MTVSHIVTSTGSKNQRLLFFWFMSKKDQAVEHSLFSFYLYDGQGPFKSHCIVIALKRQPFGQKRIIGTVLTH